MYTQIQHCRLCGNPNLVSFLNLGHQVLTGVFPKTPTEVLTAGPLELVKCHSDAPAASCGLVQLRHSFPLGEMYGDNYGYRSGLNQSMVRHLHHKVQQLRQFLALQPGDVVLDIGSNDSTLLQAYPADQNLVLVGMDPTGKKFKDYYPPHIHLIPDFFSAPTFAAHFGEHKARVITSIAMFYDLENPLDFVQQVAATLADDGVWVFEQSYMPSMLAVNAYDTICHEHLEYYGLQQIVWLTARAGLKILAVELNAVNGGSFSVMACKAEAPYTPNTAQVQALLAAEAAQGLHTLAPYHAFREQVLAHARALKAKVQAIHAAGHSILGYGASTKGNVLLQLCGITAAELPAIAEVNADKFGRFTPGTHIPIISEQAAHAQNPDYFLVLPWHFRENLVAREAAYLQRGGRLLFPLPHIEEVTA